LDHYTDPDEAYLPDDQTSDEDHVEEREFLNEEPHYLVHALDESLEDHMPLKQEPKEEIHKENHQPFEVEHELHCELIEGHFNETHHEDKTFVFSPPVNEDEVIQASIPPAHEEENMVSCTSFQVFDVASFHDLESRIKNLN
jgi:hypothetical protein